MEHILAENDSDSLEFISYKLQTLEQKNITVVTAIADETLLNATRDAAAAWNTYRKAQSHLEGVQKGGSGTSYKNEYLKAYIKMTNERIEYLSDILRPLSY